ncbi:hypothetical protein DVH26_23810 [Paenibacillus sp. H1-7]|uniref:hypothetical protein n=1 Tax=Paenibacillus sp. H1-7 TaxID=2282849 RepID=UPI001EF88C28|nr:hypothetical protein [Paenibacillus sp. H1-7]ULL17199.1 hypothetical protein DVH26_23810 [Paenibacillus sp. H1-7]
MRFTVQYIPLDKLKPDVTARMTSHLRKLRGLVWDCMHLLVVRKNRKEGSYTIVLGHDRFQFLREHTKKRAAPCLIDESKPEAEIRSWLHRLQEWRERKRERSISVPGMKRRRLSPVAWAVASAFLREEPRFKKLSASQKYEVLLLAIRYKKTIIAAMKSKVDRFTS